MKQLAQVHRLLDSENGILLASTAAHAGLHRQHLSELVDAGILERTGRGVYVQAGGTGDELYSLQMRAGKIVYSHETALFLHGLTDRTPFRYTITVPNSYKPSDAIKAQCAVFYIRDELSELGKCETSSGMGHTVFTYNLERTLCDIIRSRNKLDTQIVIESVKRYAARKDKNLVLLTGYAKTFRVSRTLNHYLEVLL